MQVSFSYLDRQFADLDGYLKDVRELVLSGEFTLGPPLISTDFPVGVLISTASAEPTSKNVTCRNLSGTATAARQTSNKAKVRIINPVPRGTLT